MVIMCSMPREQPKADHVDDVNWEPRLEVRMVGTPKPEIHSTRTAIQVLAEVGRSLATVF